MAPSNRVALRSASALASVSAKDGEADAVTVKEVRRRHRLRNDSRIADLFEGFFKSTVVCPVCKVRGAT